MDDFAISIDKIQKLIFSNTIKETGWESAKLASKTLEEHIIELKKQAGKDILIGRMNITEYFQAFMINLS